MSTNQSSHRLRASNSSRVCGLLTAATFSNSVDVLRSCFIKGTLANSGACLRCKYFNGYSSALAWLLTVHGESKRPSCRRNKEKPISLIHRALGSCHDRPRRAQRMGLRKEQHQNLFQSEARITPSRHPPPIKSTPYS